MNVAEHPKLEYPSKVKLDEIISKCMACPQIEAPVEHFFGDGVYVRKITIPAVGQGSFAIGRFHRHPHLNVMLSGRVIVLNQDGSTKELVAPQIFRSEPGQKIGVIIEDMVWLNIYATNETDVKKLEAELFEPSPALEEAERQRLCIEAEIRLADREDFLAAIQELGYSETQVRSMSESDADMTHIPDGFSQRFVVADSAIEGRGVFASSNFNAGDRIGPCRMNVAGSLKRTALGRYVNHAKFPNAMMLDIGGGNLELVAIRSITGMRGGQCGDEITLDYRQAFAESQKHFKQLS